MNGNIKKEEKRPLFEKDDVETMTNLYSVAGSKVKVDCYYFLLAK